MAGGFIYENIANSYNSLTATSEDEDFPVTNIVNGVISEKYKSEASTTTIVWDFGEVKTFEAIAILEHNLSDGDTITLELSNDGFTTVDETINITVNKKNLYKLFDTQKQYQYLRLNITKTSGIIEIGEIYIGLKYVFEKNYNWGYSRIYNLYADVENVNGQFFQANKTEQRGYKLQFSYMTKQQAEMFEMLTKQPALVFFEDENEPDCLHGIITTKAPEWVIDLGYYSGEIVFMGNSTEVE